MDPEINLMTRVKRLAGPYLDKVTSSTPVSFWAALTANESGVWLQHDTNVPPRFETSAMEHLRAALDTGIPWGAVTKAQLLGKTTDDLKLLASSWGFTQVMGYQTLGWTGATVHDLNDPATHYTSADRVLKAFIFRFRLNPTTDADKMFNCWNTGNPVSPTHDPAYVSNGLNRMKIWDALGGN